MATIQILLAVAALLVGLVVYTKTQTLTPPTTPTATFTSRIPSNVSKDRLLSTLHNHSFMIRAVAPKSRGHKLISGDPSSKAVYSVTDKKPIGEVTFSFTLTNVPDGIDSRVDSKTPFGKLVAAGKWRVGDDGVLREDLYVTANAFMTK